MKEPGIISEEDIIVIRTIIEVVHLLFPDTGGKKRAELVGLIYEVIHG